jgi:FixJ family two-component response regulator
MSSKADIAIVDSDATVRQALTLLLPAYGVTVKAFASSREFLDSLAKHRRPPGSAGVAVEV